MQRRYTKLYQIADLYSIMYRLAVLALTVTHGSYWQPISARSDVTVTSYEERPR